MGNGIEDTTADSAMITARSSEKDSSADEKTTRRSLKRLRGFLFNLLKTKLRNFKRTSSSSSVISNSGSTELQHINLCSEGDRHSLRLKSLALSAEPKNECLFNFPALPTDLKIYLLEVIFIVEGGIHNPWFQNGYDQPWSMLLNFNLLSTCKEIHYLGIPILYGENLFQTTAFDHDLVDLVNHPVSFASWMASPMSWNLENGTKVRFRHELVRKIAIQEHPLEGDSVVRISHGEFSCANCTNSLLLRWMFRSTDYLAGFAVQLDYLAITLDQANPELGRYLENEMDTKRLMAGAGTSPINYLPDGGVWRFPQDYVDLQKAVALAANLKVRSLCIVGTDPVESRDEESTTKNQHRRAVVDWLDLAGVKYEKLHFTGRFKKREISNDVVEIEISGSGSI